jgi:hypothetical protein
MVRVDSALLVAVTAEDWGASVAAAVPGSVSTNTRPSPVTAAGARLVDAVIVIVDIVANVERGTDPLGSTTVEALRSNMIATPTAATSGGRARRGEGPRHCDCLPDKSR